MPKLFCGGSLQYQSAFQSSNVIGWIRVYEGWVRVNLGCCQGNSTYVYIVVYNWGEPERAPH